MSSPRHEAAGLIHTNGIVARCTCGWTSEPMSRAGLAHAALDAHIERAAQEPSSSDGCAGSS